MVASLGMPDPTFRGDPYGVLGVSHAASSSRSSVAGETWLSSTTQTARQATAASISASPRGWRASIPRTTSCAIQVRRARYDASPAARRRQHAEGGRPNGARPGMDERDTASAGPPPPPRTRPVTARYDTTAIYHRRNTTISRGRTPLSGHPRVGRRRGEMELRASTPTGPVERRRSGPPPRLPSLESARSTSLEFGRFHGHTLGEVADLEPTYIDWIARTITRDRIWSFGHG